MTGEVIFGCAYRNKEEREENINYAREYISENGYTNETAAIADVQNNVIIVRKK